MRVLFTTYPQKTHFMAMAPLAWALRTAGHEVVFASQPKFCDVITQAGLTAVPIGTNRDLEQILARDANWFRIGLNGMPVPYDSVDWPRDQVTWSYLQDGYEIQVPKWHRMSNVPLVTDLVEFARHWKPDLVIWEPSTYAGSLAAKACGAAHARMLFSVDSFGVARERYVDLKRGRTDQSDPLADWLSTYCRTYGFEFSEELITGQFTISLVPQSLGIEAGLQYLPVRHIPYAGAAAVPAWLNKQPDRPRVAITMGISTANLTGEVVDLPDVLEELADLDIEIVATLSEAAQKTIATVPDNVRLVSYVPLHALVPTCSAVMHHGGIGTLLTIAAHGKPQLILPWNNDGPSLARRVAAQGAGLALHVFQGSGRPVRDRLLRILKEPKFQEAADRLSAEIRAMPSPNEIVGDLEKLTAGLRPAI
ncbi:activator-dependent family glycosyltransferase [Actinocrispum sp. NPDC049592]|uniref:activator-dependent family glycosyltransferase n=1 Tax=Actinocrispum sp. NPDC049592 TaxID=3154835 RepID=UPI003441AEE3